MNFNFWKKSTKIILAAAVVFFAAAGSLFAEKYSPDQESGFEAYRKNDWTGAMFFLRKAGSTASGYDEETLYMLVMSEMYAGEYKSALSDSNLFLQKFNSSSYAPYMQFQKGRALHFLGRNEDAVLVLSDFCHQNQDNELYASALYWIAESFYAEYNFDYARALYERISQDFPSDPKVTDARYRIEMIGQREREEKLVYLLKVTGEENLAAREELERQIKLYQTEDKMGLHKNLSDAEAKIADLETQLDQQKAMVLELTNENANLARAAEEKSLSVKNAEEVSAPVPASIQPKAPEAASEETAAVSEKNTGNGKILPEYTESYPVKPRDPEVEALKKKAQVLQYILDEQVSDN